MNSERPILFFDGFCNLCNRAVLTVIRLDKKKYFRLASLQSQAGQDALSLLAKSGVPPDSVVLLYNDKYYVKSDAVLHSLRLLGGPWKLLFGGVILPRFLRDRIYNFIASHRYKWFGKKQTCMMPTPELMERFI